MPALTPFRTALLKAGPIVTTVTGAGTGSWGSLAGTASGGVERFGVATGSFGALSGTVVGTPEVFGVATGSFGSLTGTISAAGTIFGVATGTFGRLTGTIQNLVIGTSQFAVRNATRVYGVRRAGR